MKIQRSSFAASLAPALGSDYVVAVGGFTGNNVTGGVTYNELTASVEVFDAASGAWVTPSVGVPDLPCALMGVGAASLPTALGGELVVTGGFGYEASGAFFYTQSTYVLRASGDADFPWEWVPGANFPWARSGLSCASTSSGVLCAGGGSTDPAYASAALYDGVSWAPVASMLEARNWFGFAAAVDPSSGREVVYAAGGFCCAALPNYCFFSPLASVERFDVGAGNWTEAPPMPYALASNGAAALPVAAGSGLVVVGGNPAGFVLVATEL